MGMLHVSSARSTRQHCRMHVAQVQAMGHASQLAMHMQPALESLQALK